MELACCQVNESQIHDRTLFDSLVRKHHKQSYNVAFRMCGNHPDAEDLTQEAFIRAFRFFAHYKQDMPFEGWFYRIMINVFIEKFRKKPKFTVWSLDAPVRGAEGDFTVELPDSGHGPEESLLMMERESQLQDALKSLPDKFRFAVIYADIEGMSYEEVAETMQINIGTVRSRIYRGRRMLRDILSGMGFRLGGEK